MEENSKDLSERVWSFFSSMKLGLALLGILALVSAMGTLIPQEAMDLDKANATGDLWKTLGMTHLYSAVWFRLLLGLLCINLIVCSTHRLKSIYIRTFKLVPPSKLTQVPQKNRLVVQGELTALRESVQEVMIQKGFRFTLSDQADQWSFIAIKRRLGNWGSLITHLAFVVLVIGALLGSLLGFKGYFMEGAGTTVPIHDLEVSKGTVSETFSVRINSAEDRLLPNGERDNWYTDLSILENGKETARKTISVNHPLEYNGVTFYQASFAEGAVFTSEMKDEKSSVVLRNYNQGGSFYQAPGTDLFLVINLAKNSSQQQGVLFKVYKGTAPDPIQSGQLMTGETVDVQGSYRLTFDGLAGFTGLQVKKDPGVAVIWLGCGLLLVGLLLAFYWQPLVISGMVQFENEKRATLTIGALAGKMPDSAREALEQFVGSVTKMIR